MSLLAALRPMSLWSPIGLPDSQALIDVRLRHGQCEFDVTRSHVILSLAPLQIGIGNVTPGQLHEGQAEMRFCDRATGAELGSLRLVEDGALAAAGARVACFRVTRGSHACLPMPIRLWQSWLQRRRGSSHTSFRMRHDAVAQLAVFYICPRPVVLVSVDDGTSSNLFPMDLIGPVGGEWFVLALRNTSASVATLEITRRAALADVALTERALAYSLGKHHRNSVIDWSGLPCPTTRSSRFGLRVPEQALRVRECEVLSAEQRGSHTVFVCRVASDELRIRAPRLFHTSGIHGAWRRRRGVVPWQEPAP